LVDFFIVFLNSPHRENREKVGFGFFGRFFAGMASFGTAARLAATSLSRKQKSISVAPSRAACASASIGPFATKVLSLISRVRVPIHAWAAIAPPALAPREY
jgi:hypothetical protein